MVPEMGAGWCPPGMLGVGIGGSAEKAMLLAKESLMEPIDIAELIARGPKTKLEELRLEIYQRVNALGIGAQGLGGLTTVLDVKVFDYPTHAASLPVAVIPNCAATRHIHFTLDGTGPAMLEPPNLDEWPKVQWVADAGARRVSLDGLTHAEIATFKPGERLLLSGKLLTGGTQHTSVSAPCSRRENRFPRASISRVASSTTSGRSIPSVPRWWVPRGPPPPIEWIASPIPCSANPACSPWSARRSADPRRWPRLPNTIPRT
jgi:hypothetical protein